jgi:hypothetical protein
MLPLPRLVGGSGRVVSLEANPRTYKRLVDLRDVNGLANVKPLQIAASTETVRW